MSKGTEVGRDLRDAMDEIYGRGSSPNSVFDGGNVGNALLGRSIEIAAQGIATAINRLAASLEAPRDITEPTTTRRAETPDVTPTPTSKEENSDGDGKTP